MVNKPSKYSKNELLKNFKGPSKFSKGQSPEYQLAILKKFFIICERRRLKKIDYMNKHITIDEYLGFIPYNYNNTHNNLIKYANSINQKVISIGKKIYYPRFFIIDCFKRKLIDFPVGYRIELYKSKK